MKGQKIATLPDLSGGEFDKNLGDERMDADQLQLQPSTVTFYPVLSAR